VGWGSVGIYKYIFGPIRHTSLGDMMMPSSLENVPAGESPTDHDMGRVYWLAQGPMAWRCFLSGYEVDLPTYGRHSRHGRHTL